VDEAGLAEHTEMPRDGRPTDVKSGGELAGGNLAIAHELQHPPPDRIRDRNRCIHNA
jgi:hypothetical protein